LPGRPDTLQASHGTYLGFVVPGAAFNFQIHPRKPDCFLLPIAEKWTDNEGNSHDRQRWFYSKDAGADWTEIWSDTLRVEMRHDRRSPGVVWITATDGTWGASKNASYQAFKKDLRSTGDVGVDRKHARAAAPVLRFRETGVEVTGNTSFDEVSIIDVLGRECLRVMRLNRSLTSQFFTTSFVPSSSQYFGVFRSKEGSVIVVPVQIER
jgi:hypothetical protein